MKNADSHTLHTHITTITQHAYRVFWRVGGRIGVIEITLEPDLELSDQATAAELAAIQHLLSDKEIMGANRTGKGVILNVSRGAIRKLKIGSSSKADLTPYAVFLNTRYHEAVIEVGKKAPWVPTAIEGLEHVHLNVSGPRYETINTPCMGRVVVTKHAIEQYEDRFCEGDLSRTWVSLTKRLQNPELAPIVLPPRVLKHKLMSYGDKAATIWRHPDGTLHFAVVDDPSGTRVLVTVFYRSETEIDRSTTVQA
jgi:hypothetical protein